MVGYFLNKNSFCLCIICCLLFDPSPSHAWQKELAIGFLQTNGNSASKSNNLKLSLIKNEDYFLYNLNISAFNQSKQRSNTAEEYKILAQVDKKINRKKSIYFLFLTEDDRFSGFDYQSSINFGYGKTLIKNDKSNLQIRFGPGYRISSIPQELKEKELTLRFSEKYELAISENADLKQNFSISSGEDNSIMNFDLSTSASITDALSLALIFEYKYIENVPIGKKKFDSKTSMQFGYKF